MGTAFNGITWEADFLTMHDKSCQTEYMDGIRLAKTISIQICNNNNNVKVIPKTFQLQTRHKISALNTVTRVISAPFQKRQTPVSDPAHMR